MPFNGSGVWSYNYSWVLDAANGIPITASRMDAQFNDAGDNGFDNCLTRDGQGSASANTPWNGFKITGLGVATTSGDALSYGQPITTTTIAGTSLTLSGTIGAAFGTAGVKFISSAFTQTDSTTAVGTVATAYGSLLGATTFATATNAITITNGYGIYFQAPVAGSHVTLTHAVALGADSIGINGASLGTSATAVKFATTSATVVGTSGVFLALQNSGATANEGRWISTASGSNITLFSAQTDSGLTSFDWFTVSRTGLGAALPNVTFAPASFTLSTALTYGGVTLSNAVTGTGNMVLSASPTLSGTVGGALTFSGALTLSSALTYGGVTLSNAVTGTGNMVLSAGPTFTGTIAAVNISATGTIKTTGDANQIIYANTAAQTVAVLTSEFGFVGSGNKTDVCLANNLSGGAINLHVNGSNTIGAQLKSTALWNWSSYGAGTITSDGSGNITSVSDETQKHIIGPYLATVDNIKPIVYKWREESGMETEHEYAGFSAQNCNAADPLMTGRTPAGLLTLQDRALLAATINSIHKINDKLAQAGIA